MKKLLAVFLMLLLPLFGCSPKQTTTAPAQFPQQTPAQEEPQQSASSPNEKMIKVTLYFPDKQAQYLVKVKKEIKVTDGAIVRAIIGELQKGDAQYPRTIPVEAKLLGATVKEGIVHLDFSREFRDKHWGGSAGEGNTIYSIVNSLTELPGIKGVQFYLEGKIEESILGHADWRKPFDRNEQLIKK